MEFSNMHDSDIVEQLSGSQHLSCNSADGEPEPVSRTYQYRKVMKPLLERKRRARINRCLDDLKDLMVNALQSEGENVAKLEKADILELTVQHLQKLRRQQRLSSGSPMIESDRFRAGFTHAANEVSRCLAATPGVNVTLGTKLMTHLGHRLNELDVVQPLSIQVNGPATGTTTTSSSTSNTATTDAYSPASSPGSATSEFSTSCDTDDEHRRVYAMPLTPASSSRSCHSETPSPRPMEFTRSAGLLKCVSPPAVAMETENVWRPW